MLDLQIKSPTYACELTDEAPLLEAVATTDEAAETVTIFAVNRSQTESLGIEGDLRSLPGLEVVEHIVLEHEDSKARNTAECPDKVGSAQSRQRQDGRRPLVGRAAQTFLERDPACETGSIGPYNRNQPGDGEGMH